MIFVLPMSLIYGRHGASLDVPGDETRGITETAQTVVMMTGKTCTCTCEIDLVLEVVKPVSVRW